MMRKTTGPIVLLLVAVVVAPGCFATKKSMNEELARVRQDMQAGDQALGTRVDGLTQEQTRLSGRIDNLDREAERLRTELADLNVKVTRLNGLIAFDVPVHFEFGKAALAESDEAVLKRFASVVREFYPNALITAEGYTDPAGSTQYNLRLGTQRADAVRGYLTSEAGLGPEQVRAVSYGEATNRLIERNAAGPGEKGRPNRRVVLVIDYVGMAVTGAAPRVITE